MSLLGAGNVVFAKRLATAVSPLLAGRNDQDEGFAFPAVLQWKTRNF